MKLRAFGREQAKFVAPTSRPVSNNEPSGAASCRPSSLGQPQGSAGGVAVVGSNWLSCGGSPIGSGQDCSRFEPDAPVPAVRGTAAEPPESTRLRDSLRGPERRLSPTQRSSGQPRQSAQADPKPSFASRHRNTGPCPIPATGQS